MELFSKSQGGQTRVQGGNPSPPSVQALVSFLQHSQLHVHPILHDTHTILYLDVLEVHISILAEVHNGAKEVEKSFKALERLKQLNECISCELFVILCGNLDTNLEILANVCLQHSPEALQRIFNRQRAKVIDQPIGIEQLSVDNGTFDIVDIGVVLKRTLQEACLLTELGNVGLVVVGEHLVAHDCICNLCKQLKHV